MVEFTMREESNNPDVGAKPQAAPPPSSSPSSPSRGEKPAYHPHGKQSAPRAVRSMIFAHLGGILISLVLCFALVPLMTGLGLILTIPLTLGVYLATIYGTLWGMGHDDANLANFGHIDLDSWRGLKIYALAMTPFYVLSLFFLACYFFRAPWFTGLAIAYKVISANVWPIMNAFQVSSAQPDIALWQAVIMTALPAVALPFSHLAYHLGTKDFSIMQKLIYKNKGKKKKKQGPKPPKSQYTPSR